MSTAAFRRLWPEWDRKTEAIDIVLAGRHRNHAAGPQSDFYPMFDDTSLSVAIYCTIRPALHKSQRNVA
jgi:hypothetical protein